jgi:hypothetical protein
MAWYPASYAGRPPGAATTSSWFPATFRLPAFASWASCSRQWSWAPLTVGLPALAPGPSPTTYRTLTGFPCSARVRPGWGWVPSIPRGWRCPHGRECSTSAACRIATAKSLPARHCYPTRTVMLTRHQRGFPVSHPMPSVPLACGPRTERGPLGFPVSFAPSRYRPRTSRWGRVLDTDPRSRRRHCRPPSNGLTHYVRPHVAGISHTSGFL